MQWAVETQHFAFRLHPDAASDHTGDRDHHIGARGRVGGRGQDGNRQEPQLVRVSEQQAPAGSVYGRIGEDAGGQGPPMTLATSGPKDRG